MLSCHLSHSLFFFIEQDTKAMARLGNFTAPVGDHIRTSWTFHRFFFDVHSSSSFSHSYLQEFFKIFSLSTLMAEERPFSTNGMLRRIVLCSTFCFKRIFQDGRQYGQAILWNGKNTAFFFSFLFYLFFLFFKNTDSVF